MIRIGLRLISMRVLIEVTTTCITNTLSNVANFKVLCLIASATLSFHSNIAIWIKDSEYHV